MDISKFGGGSEPSNPWTDDYVSDDFPHAKTQNGAKLGTWWRMREMFPILSYPIFVTPNFAVFRD